MEELGLELVLNGLDSFVGGLDQAKGGLIGVLEQPSLLQDAFSSLGDTLGGFADWIGNVFTYTVGGLLKDALEGILGVLSDIASNAIDAGNAFQVLSIRLQGINFNDPTTNLSQFTDGMDKAKQMTQDEIRWIQQMAIITPFSAEGIASVYTMQRAMGDSDSQAKDLTVSITNWAAGMGLGEDSVLRLSTALGKATSAGKVDGITMRALRSEFVPIPAVLQQMASDLGTTTDALEKMQKKGELAPLPFITAFEEVANKRFPDAANALAHTWQGALNNIQDIFSNFGGADIVKPILDVMGQFAGSIVDIFAVMTSEGPKYTEWGTRLEAAAMSIGDSLSSIVSQVLGLLPSASSIGEAVVTGLEGLANWLVANSPKIVSFIKEIIDWFANLWANPSGNFLIGQLESIVQELTYVNKHTKESGLDVLLQAMGNVASAIINIFAPSLDSLNKNLGDNYFSVWDIIRALNSFANWINDNKPMIQGLIDAFIAFEVIQTVENLVIGLISGLVGMAVTVAAVSIAFVAIVAVIAIVVTAVTLLVIFIDSLHDALLAVEYIVIVLVDVMVNQFNFLQQRIKEAVDEIVTAFKNGDWVGVIGGIWDLLISGFAALVDNLKNALGDAGAKVAQGFSDGFTQKWLALLGGIVTTIAGLIDSVKTAFGISSPSTVFHDIGGDVVQGFENGISDAWSALVTKVTGYFSGLAGTIVDSFKSGLKDLWSSMQSDVVQDFKDLATSVVQGFINGFNSMWNTLISDATNNFQALVTWIKSLLGISSPSVVFSGIGENMVAGLSQGITGAMGQATDAMSALVSSVTTPISIASPVVSYSTMSPGGVSNTYQNTNNLSLSIHSAASRESVVADFAMMQSLVGTR